MLERLARSATDKGSARFCSIQVIMRLISLSALGANLMCCPNLRHKSPTTSVRYASASKYPSFRPCSVSSSRRQIHSSTWIMSSDDNCRWQLDGGIGPLRALPWKSAT